MLGSLERNIKRQEEKLKRAQKAATKAYNKLAKYKRRNASRSKIADAKNEVLRANAILAEEEVRLRIMQTSRTKQESQLRIAERDSSGRSYQLFPERRVTRQDEWER